jgi:hypothetical protein
MLLSDETKNEIKKRGSLQWCYLVSGDKINITIDAPNNHMGKDEIIMRWANAYYDVLKKKDIINDTTKAISFSVEYSFSTIDMFEDRLEAMNELMPVKAIINTSVTSENGIIPGMILSSNPELDIESFSVERTILKSLSNL